MTIAIHSRGGPHPVSRTLLQRRASRMLTALGREGAELSVMLVDDASIHELNKTYRGIDRPTDVLSFAMQEGEFGAVNPDLLGDVIISVPTAGRQAARAHHELIDEVTHLLAHGLLHLLGYDHANDDDEREMKRETRRLVQAAQQGR